ncbi:hypothetical protein C8J56DRAFT_980466 [Mycena floridula]|nr:hypothetical protein C8J56DRAFT_980466 [Mycena floridula]
MELEHCDAQDYHLSQKIHGNDATEIQSAASFAESDSSVSDSSLASFPSTLRSSTQFVAVEANNKASQPFPELPVELVFLIIEKLLESYPKRALELMTLCRDVKPIAERVLYRFIWLETKEPTRLFIETINSGSRPQTFYGHVKMLCITYPLDLDDLSSILSTCSCAQTLGIYVWEGDDSDTLIPGLDTSLDVLASSGPRPARLSCDFRWVIRPGDSRDPHRFSLLLFHNVTHLELHDQERFEAFDGKQLHCLTNLTHLCLMTHRTVTSKVLELLGKLCLADIILVCIIHPQFRNNHRIEFPNKSARFTNDPRVVIVLSPEVHVFAQLAEQQIESQDFVWRDLFEVNHVARQCGLQIGEKEMDLWEEAEGMVEIQRARLQNST